jgi:translation initiation factor 2 subunit 3
MDGVILIIGVKDKLEMKPQLIQHLLGIKMGGIKRLIVCLNKIDLVSKDVLLEYKKDVDALFNKYGIKPNYIIPTSFNKGIGLNWVLNAIQELFNPTILLEKTKDIPVLKISRSFDINKPGTDWIDIKGGVIGGTITSGQFKVGDVIEIKPGRINKRTGVAIPIKTIIKSIQTGSTNLDVGYAGGLVAIGTDIDPFETKNDGLVGNLCGYALPEIVSEISFNIEWIDKPVKLDNLCLLIGTRMCKALLDNEIFKLEKPMCILPKEQIIVCQDINGMIKVIGVKI